MRPTVWFLIGIVAISGSLVRAQDGASNWQFSLQGTYYYGSVDGYVQTPNGGEPGTTSNKRPKLDEIGISETSIYDIAGIAAYHREEIYAGAQIIQMSGSDTLSAPLISHGVSFPAGTHVSSDVDLNWYRLGYRHRFTLGSDEQWSIWPSVGAVLWDASYHLSGGGGTADRSHTTGNVQFGLEAQWRPRNGPFSINASVLAAPPISDLPEIYTEQLVATYRVLEREKSELAIFGGVMWEQQYYEDNQTVSNKVKADFGPMLVVGLRFSF
jgi:hypothetical protein